MCLVIEYADPSFEGRTVCASLEPKIAIVKQVCNILQETRKHLREGVRRTPSEPH